MTQTEALNILKTGANVFLTGEPGSGKTHTTNEYTGYLRRRKIEAAITASTGIAATHIGGMTIHSWSGIGVRRRLSEYDLENIISSERVFRRVQNARVLIIDEISMLSADTLAMVDAVCREVRRSPELAFGGLQVIFVGDFFQLPAVTEVRGNSEVKFAYESAAWAAADPVVCYLGEQYRQDDSDFLDILKAIRGNTFDSTHEKQLRARQTAREGISADVPRLFPHNSAVDRLNDEMLGRLPGKPKEFTMSQKGPRKLVESLKKGCLSPEALLLKSGAAVMFTKNNPKAGFVNGTLGVIESFDSATGLPVVRTRNNRAIRVEPADWNLEENGRVRARITQLPLRLAWAITVHKSQGMSLDAAAMDLSSVFEYGQGYVALSRVRRLAGLHIFGWNERTFQIHPGVAQRDQAFREISASAEAAIAGMAAAELQAKHEEFARRCGGVAETAADTEQSDRDGEADTYSMTLLMWKDGKSVKDIAAARQLQESTILSHIEKLLQQSRVDRADLARLLTPALSRVLPQIHAAFHELGAEQLSPVKAKFGDAYSYDALRIARMAYVSA